MKGTFLQGSPLHQTELHGNKQGEINSSNNLGSEKPYGLVSLMLELHSKGTSDGIDKFLGHVPVDTELHGNKQGEISASNDLGLEKSCGLVLQNTGKKSVETMADIPG